MPLKIDYKDREQVIAYAKKLGPGWVVFKIPGNDEYFVKLAVHIGQRYPIKDGEITIVYRT